MNQASDMLLIQCLAFLEKKLLFLEKTLKLMAIHTALKTKQVKIKSSNIVKKYSLVPWQDVQYSGKF